MALFSDLATDGQKISTFLSNLVSGVSKLKTIISQLSGPTIAASAAVFYDVVKAVDAGEGAAATAATGNVPAAITLSQTTIALVKQVVTDFHAGEKIIVSDFTELGIALPKRKT
jgi:hypothetical protein